MGRESSLNQTDAAEQQKKYYQNILVRQRAQIRVCTTAEMYSYTSADSA